MNREGRVIYIFKELLYFYLSRYPNIDHCFIAISALFKGICKCVKLSERVVKCK